MEKTLSPRAGPAGRALRAALPHTLPILAGFLFLGMTYGVYMRVSGFAFWYPIVMAMTIFAGSMEFVTASFLLGPYHPLQAFAMTLMINARHLFYGLSMLERYRGLGWKKFFLIFWMCDETFSVNCSTDVPDGVDRGWFYFWVSLLDYIYWVSGAALGGIFGALLTFDLEGLSFVMTAMFVVIFLEQWLKDRRHMPALLGLGLSAVCRLIFGADSFLIPSMLAMLAALTLLRRPLEQAEKGGERA
mgnify:CR=1 FL=1